MVKGESPYIPDRGDVMWITLNPQAGHDQAGRPFALVLSSELYKTPIFTDRKNVIISP